MAAIRIKQTLMRVSKKTFTHYPKHNEYKETSAKMKKTILYASFM